MLFLPLLRNSSLAYLHLRATYTVASKLSGCTTGVTKSEASVGNTLFIVRDALASDRCIYLCDSKRLQQRPPEASRLQVRDNDSKRTVKILLGNAAFQKGRNYQNKRREHIQAVFRRQRLCKNINSARTRGCTRFKVGQSLACSIMLTIAIQRHKVEGMGLKETLDLPPSPY